MKTAEETRLTLVALGKYFQLIAEQSDSGRVTMTTLDAYKVGAILETAATFIPKDGTSQIKEG